MAGTLIWLKTEQKKAGMKLQSEQEKDIRNTK